MTPMQHTIQHTAEGCAYLIYLSIFVRWKFPKKWNKAIEILMVKDLSINR